MKLLSAKDWKIQLANIVNSVDDLKKYVNVSVEEEAEIKEIEKKYKWGISPYYASLMDKNDRNCPIRMQAIPSAKESYNIFNIDSLPSFHKSSVDSENPLWKEGKTELDCIIWRYPNRVVFHLTNLCLMNCRHCARKVKNYQNNHIITENMIDKGIDFIRNNHKIDDVLLSGGDPLILDDDKLEYVISNLRRIPHVDIIRIGTRAPCTLPQRITAELCGMLEKYHPIWVNTQFNHPKEITAESEEACNKLLKAGIPLGNQSVLLKGINDTAETQRNLLKKLAKIRVRPYYLYHADLVRGTEHFRTSLATGMDIMENLSGHISGFQVPSYVICTPLGKTPLQPNYLVSTGKGYLVVRNYEWRIWKDPDIIESENYEY